MEKLIALIIIKITYVCTYLLPINKNKVAIISYFNNELGEDFQLLYDGLKKDNFILKTDLVKLESNTLGKFKYLFHFIKHVYFYNTCKVIILDGNNYVYANIKVKKQVKTIQLWHATGAIKKFGQEIKRIYNIKPYDYVIVGADCFKKSFATALNTPIDNVLVLGVSKTDYLFNQEYIKINVSNIRNKYDLNNKRIILYAPTFRGDGFNDMQIDLEEILRISKLLNHNDQLLVKLHPLILNELILPNDIIDVSNEKLYPLLISSDIIISDYSALVFDSIVLNKPTILYLYDFNEYKLNRGLSIELDALGLDIAYNIIELKELLNKNINGSSNLLLKELDGNSTTRIITFIKAITK